MADLTKITLIGRLGQDPEQRFTQDGRPSLRFRMATSTRRKSREGNWEDATQWFGVSYFGRGVESLQSMLTKGSRVYVEGRLDPARIYQGQNGPAVALDVLANEVLALDSRQRDAGESGESGLEGGSERPAPPAPPRGRAAPAPVEDAGDVDDLPF